MTETTPQPHRPGSTGVRHQTKENSLPLGEGGERSPLGPARSLGSGRRGARTSGAVQ